MEIKTFVNKRRSNYFYFLIITFILVNCNLYSQSGKPDLIITNVEFKYERPNRIHKPGEPASGSDNLPQPRFYVTVKNIGNKDLSDAFYITYTNDEGDIRKGRYSHLNLVNSDKGIIKVNESISIKVGGYFPGSSNHFKFCILNDAKDFNEHMIPPIEEKRYDNNTYECSLPNFK